MKGNLLLILAGAATALLVWTGMFAFLLYYPLGGRLTLDSIYEIKERGLAQTPPPRIVLVGGSGTLFGFDSTAITRATGIETFNYGTNAGLGLDYLLYRARHVLKPGDKAVLVLEYEHYAYDGPREETQIQYVVDRGGDYFATLPLLEKLQYVAAMPVMRMLKSIYYRLSPRDIPLTGVYAQENFSERGDLINIDVSLRPERDLLRIINAPPVAMNGISAHARRILSDFARFARANGIELFLAPPAILDKPAYHTDKARAFYRQIEEMARELGIVPLGDPEDFTMPEQDFFDTVYHLHNASRARRTARFIALLKPYISQRPQVDGRGPGYGQASSAPR